MRYYLMLMLFIVLSCGRDKMVPESLMQNALNIATQFAATKLDSSTVITDNNGMVSISDEMVRYVIDPQDIFYAEIDEISGKDILVSIDSLHDPYLMPAWHLVLKKEGEEIKTIVVIRSDMRVLSIDNQILVAEIPTHSPNSPLYYCSECRDTVSYRIVGGKIIPKDKSRD